MATDATVRLARFLGLAPALILMLSLSTFGCGPSEETIEGEGEEDWETAPTVSPTAKLEYRIDSLSNENRRLHEQVDAVASENRRLTARNAELESRPAEAGGAPAATPVEAGAPAAISGDAQAAYETALDAHMRGNSQGAIEQFDALLRSDLPSGLEDNCHYWMGEAYYKLKNYNEAVGHFEKVLGYQASNKKPYAQMMLGNAYARLGNPAAAREAYNKVISDYPTSPLVAKAQQQLGRLK